jgi:hypothetical protein
LEREALFTWKFQFGEEMRLEVQDLWKNCYKFN